MKQFLFYSFFLLAACSQYWQHNNTFQDKSIKPLYVPPDLTSSAIQNYYPVHQTNTPTKPTPPVKLTPPKLSKLLLKKETKQQTPQKVTLFL